MNVNKRSIKTKFSALAMALIVSLTWAPAVASADSTPATTSPNPTGQNQTSQSSGKSPSQTADLSNIIAKGNEEITRRLNNLVNLSTLINSNTKLTDADKTALLDAVSTTESGLNTLKTQLDSETTVTAARTDVQSILTEYRVYALIYPKVHIVKAADDQQVIEAKLTELAGKLQTRLTSLSQSGQSVSSLTADLTSMNSSITAAEAISSQIETNVINLQPTDYNSNHSVMSTYNTQLETARKDIQSAYDEAKAIISGIEALTSSSASNTTNTAPATN